MEWCLMCLALTYCRYCYEVCSFESPTSTLSRLLLLKNAEVHLISFLYSLNLHELLFAVYVAHTRNLNVNRTRNLRVAHTTLLTPR